MTDKSEKKGFGGLSTLAFEADEDVLEKSPDRPIVTSNSESTISQVNNPDYAKNITTAQEETFWTQALDEFEGASRRQGLWAKSFAEAQGMENVAKAAYLRKRFSELLEEHIERAAELGSADAEFLQETIDNENNNSPTDDEVMQVLGISFDGEKYHFHGTLFSSLENSIKYAINTYDEHGYTSLMRVAGAGKIHLVKALISFGANPKLTGRISGKPTALSMTTVSLNRADNQHDRDTYQNILDFLIPIT